MDWIRTIATEDRRTLRLIEQNDRLSYIQRFRHPPQSRQSLVFCCGFFARARAIRVGGRNPARADQNMNALSGFESEKLLSDAIVGDTSERNSRTRGGGRDVRALALGWKTREREEKDRGREMRERGGERETGQSNPDTAADSERERGRMREREDDLDEGRGEAFDRSIFGG